MMMILILIPRRLKKFSKKARALALLNQAKQYGGIPVLHEGNKPWDRAYFERELNQLLKRPEASLKKQYAELQNYTQMVRRKQAQAFSELRVPRVIQNLAHLLSESAWIRLTGRNIFAISHYLSEPLFSAIGKRHRMTKEAIKWLVPDEVEELLANNTPPDPQILIDRKSASACRADRRAAARCSVRGRCS